VALRVLAEPKFQRVAAVMLVAILAGFRIVQIVTAPGERPWAYDFSAYWLAGRHLLDGVPIYTVGQLSGSYAPQAQYLYLYPPPLAALAVPFAALSASSVTGAYLAWIALGSAFAVATTIAITRRESLDRRYPMLAGGGVWLLILAAAALPPVVGELMNGNVHLLLLGLFGLGWLGLARGERRGEVIAGSAIGIAALIKIFPGLVILWFILTRRWTAAASSIVAAAAVSIATLPITGLQPWLDYPTVLANMAGPIDSTFSFAPTTWLTDLMGFAMARIVVTVAGVGVVAWVARAADPRVGYAATVLAALLITPILWSHYVTIAVLPLVLGLAAGISLPLLGIAYVMLSTGNQAAIGEMGFVVARVLPLAGMLLLLGALLWRSRQMSGRPAEVPAALEAP
jgi:alpha-1,2-mannosyltransferase